MTKEYKHNGETFLLDDSKGCYIEVTYEGQIGYAGVDPNGTPDRPYGWTMNPSKNDGEPRLNNLGYSTLNDVLIQVCDYLLQAHRTKEQRKVFDHEKACKDLHDFVDQLEG